MNVEIWSDIACPWCAVGKRRFEAALAAFAQRDDVTVTWRSFELPSGGLVLWAELDAPRSRALAAIADRHGVRIAPGPRFGVDGAFERFLRLPFSLPEPVLEDAAERLAVAWRAVTESGRPPATEAVPALVA